MRRSGGTIGTAELDAFFATLGKNREILQFPSVTRTDASDNHLVHCDLRMQQQQQRYRLVSCADAHLLLSRSHASSPPPTLDLPKICREPNPRYRPFLKGKRYRQVISNKKGGAQKKMVLLHVDPDLDMDRVENAAMDWDWCQRLTMPEVTKREKLILSYSGIPGFWCEAPQDGRADYVVHEPPLLVPEY